jgi:hypothetical protein
MNYLILNISPMESIIVSNASFHYNLGTCYASISRGRPYQTNFFYSTRSKVSSRERIQNGGAPGITQLWKEIVNKNCNGKLEAIRLAKKKPL